MTSLLLKGETGEPVVKVFQYGKWLFVDRDFNHLASLLDQVPSLKGLTAVEVDPGDKRNMLKVENPLGFQFMDIVVYNAVYVKKLKIPFILAKRGTYNGCYCFRSRV